MNRGVGGETTEQVLLRLDRDVLAPRPGVVVVQVGVNDLRSLALFPGREAEIVGRCEANLRAIVGRLRERGAVVVVTTIFPVGRVELARRPIWSDATIDAIDRVNRSLRGARRARASSWSIATRFSGTAAGSSRPSRSTRSTSPPPVTRPSPRPCVPCWVGDRRLEKRSRRIWQGRGP